MTTDSDEKADYESTLATYRKIVCILLQIICDLDPAEGKRIQSDLIETLLTGVNVRLNSTDTGIDTSDNCDRDAGSPPTGS